MNIQFSKMHKNAQNEENALQQLKPVYAASCYMENVFLKKKHLSLKHKGINRLKFSCDLCDNFLLIN